MITRVSIPEGRAPPEHVDEVARALQALEPQIEQLWQGNGIDGRRVAALLRDALPAWQHEQSGARQELTWKGAAISAFRVDAQRDEGRSIMEIEGGGALQNNRLHRDLLNTMLSDGVEQLVLVVPNWVHNRSPFDFAVAFCARLRRKRLLPPALVVTVFGYGSPPSHLASSRKVRP